LAKVISHYWKDSIMKVAYLDCQSGISGDMFLAACVDAGANFETIQKGIDSLGTGNCNLQKQEVKKHGFRALKVDVLHEPEHAHRHLHHIDKMIDESSISERQKRLAKKIFLNLAKAEAEVHGSTLEKVHFHEVGAIDSIADIVGGAIAWDLLGADKLICSAIPTGQGHIQIAHGKVSIPAPATAILLKGIPVQTCNIQAELTTPTGAAIVATIAEEFGPFPDLVIQDIGVGAGSLDFEEQANVLRIMTGTQAGHVQDEWVTLLETNLDDVSSETIGYCTARLWEAGALDVYALSIQMKKNRPGVLLGVICSKSLSGKLKEIIFNETGTLGIRHQVISRTVLPREPAARETHFGKVAGKNVTLPNGRQKFVPEYESCAALASSANVPISEVYLAAESTTASNNSPKT
jgi:uncharacterized protein (TIGR00299 family) protein